MSMVKMITYNNKIAGEVRPAYFLKSFMLGVPSMRIFSFGACNFACPYCKRGGNFVNPDGSIVASCEATEEELLAEASSAVANGEVVRLSGGDPVMYPRVAYRLLKYTSEIGGVGSVAHNGSSLEFIRSIIPYLGFAAIDLKAATPEEYNKRAGLKSAGRKMLESSLKIIELLSSSNIPTDIRTCIFSTTTISDMLNMAGMICRSGVSNKFWTIRTYSPVDGCDWKPMPISTALEYIDIIKQEFPDLKIGIRAKWEKGGFIYK